MECFGPRPTGERYRLSAAADSGRRLVRAVLLAACLLGTAGWTTEVVPGAAKPTAPAVKPKPKAQAAPPSPIVPAAIEVEPRPAAAASVAAPAEAAPARTPGQRLPKVSGTAVALSAALEGDAAQTTLVLTLTRSAPFATFALADPNRLVVDLKDVDFRVPPVAGTNGRGLVTSFRYGLLAPGKSRIVIDVNAPVTVDKAEIVALRGADTVQLRVSLVPTSREAFLAAAVGVSAPTPHAAVAAVPPAAANGKASRKRSKPVIVLDPGHGGPDAGTLGSTNVAEKDVVLRFAKLLRDRLRAAGRFEVHLTREIDVFVKLDDRVRIARELGADLFISLHTDSVPPQIAHLNVRGATIYTLGAQDGDVRAQKLAEKENSSDTNAGVEVIQDEPPDVADILNDLMRRETAHRALAFTGTLLDYMKKSTGMSREPHRQAAFRVLRAPDMPSVLVELGYLSTPEDEKLLVARDWQEQVAATVTRAVDTYFLRQMARTAP